MISKCSIDAVHPTGKRIVKSNLTNEQMTNLLVELLDAGYEMDNIDITQEVIYEEGDCDR